MVLHPANRSAPVSRAASVRKVRVVREKIRICFIAVIRLSLFYCYCGSTTVFHGSGAAKNLSASLLGAFYFCSTQSLLRRPRSNPSRIFRSLSVNCPVRLQVEMLDGPLPGIRQVVNANNISCLEESGINPKPVRPKF